MLMKNLWDSASASVTTGDAVSTLPLVHSQRYGRSLTTGITPNETGLSVIEFNLAELSLVNGLVLYRHWLSNGAQWRLQLFEDLNCSGTELFDSGLVDAVPTKALGELNWLVDPLVSSAFDNWPFKFSQFWFDDCFAFSGRITLQDTEARDGIHEFDRVYLGRAFQPKVNFNYNSEFAWQQNTQQKQTAAGSVYAVDKPMTRQFSFQLSWIDELERPHISAAIQSAGLHKDWFISLYPQAGGLKEIEHAMSCKLSQLPVLSNPHYNNYTATYAVKEA